MGHPRLPLLVAVSLSMSSPALAQGEIDLEGTGEAAPLPGEPAAAEAPAEPAPVVKDPKVAKKWLQAGQTLMQRGDQQTKQGKPDEARTSYENAALAFQKAIEAGDDPSVYLSLAGALDKAGNTPGAMLQVKAMLAVQGLKPAMQTKAQTRLDELSMKVGLVTLQITPEGSTVTIGDKQVGEAPLAEPLVLMPGTHVVSFAAVGYQPKDVELKIEAGSETERKIELEPVPIVKKPDDLAPKVETDAPSRAPAPSIVPLVIGGGATLGLAAVATIAGMVALGTQRDYEASTDLVERDDLASRGKSFALVTDLAIVGAVGAAAFTTYWYLAHVRPTAAAAREQQALGPKVDVVPWVQLDGGGFAAVGSF